MSGALRRYVNKHVEAMWLWGGRGHGVAQGGGGGEQRGVVVVSAHRVLTNTRGQTQPRRTVSGSHGAPTRKELTRYSPIVAHCFTRWAVAPGVG